MALPVKDYPDYLVHENGKIWSNKTKRFLKEGKTTKGYCSVQLFNNHGHKNFLVHRLVAEAYLPNPGSLPQVNHKDENPCNNSVDNLEWCTAEYNMNYGNGAKTRHLKIDYTKPIYRENAIKNGKKVSIPIIMLSKTGDFIARFESSAQASRKTGLHPTTINRAANGKRKTAGGYVWRLERGNDLSACQY